MLRYNYPCMKEFVSVTIPVEAKADPPKLGILTSGLLSDYLGRHYRNVSHRVAINVLDTYRDRDSLLSAMLKAQQKLGVDIVDAWIDSHNRNDLYDVVNQLIAKGHVRAEQVPVLRCSSDCGKVEMLADVERKARSKVYEIRDGQMLCRHCHESVTQSEEWALLIRYADNITPPSVYPHILTSEIVRINESLKGRYCLVSRKRDTGLPMTVDGHNFNLDIDFFLMNYLAVVGRAKDGIILIGSEHVKAMTTQYNAVLQTTLGVENAPKLFSINPFYILGSEETKDFIDGLYIKQPRTNLLRLFVLGSISWSQDGPWNSSFLKYLRKRIDDVIVVPSTGTNLLKVEDAIEALDLVRRSTLQKAVESNNFTDLEGVLV